MSKRTSGMSCCNAYAMTESFYILDASDRTFMFVIKMY